MTLAFTDDDRPRLGLIVLQQDETIEDEFRLLFDPRAVRLHISRIPSGAQLNADTIHEMAAALPAAAGLLPPAATFDTVGYACTSGTTLIGPRRVAELIHGGCRTDAVSDPLTAAIAAIRALGLSRVGIVSPYIAPVAEAMRAAFQARGIAIPDMIHFDEESEANVARIAAISVVDAARRLSARADLDGLFLSCTNLRTLDLIRPLEADLDMPVLGSNLALAWHMAQKSGKPVPLTIRTRLTALS